MTLCEKIIANKTGRAAESAGEILLVDVDKVMIHDLFVHKVADVFYSMIRATKGNAIMHKTVNPFAI